MKKRYSLWLGLSGLIIAAIAWQFRLRFPFDDVYISFRYAEHLASGCGLVWNIGGPHTEGYTNFLFILILAAVRLFTTHLLAAAQTLGLISTIVTGILIFRIASRVRNAKVGFFATGLYFLTPLTWINALSGMETSLFVLLCVLAIFSAVSHRPMTAFFILFLATLTRPEAAMLAGIIFLTVYTKEPFQRKKAFRGLVIFILLLGLYALWKWSYFGFVLPNSFYVKVLETNASGSRMFPGLQYVRLFITSTIVLIACAAGIRGWRNSTILISSIWVVLLLAFYLFVLPLEGLYDRFLWPGFAMLTILGAVGENDLLERFYSRSFIIPFIAAVAIHITISLLTPRTQQSLAAHEDVWDRSMDGMISELKSLPHFDSLRFGYGDAGYVVYKSGISHIDLFGLNDTRIAHARSIGERKKVLEEEKPDIVLLPIKQSGSDYEWVEDADGLVRDSAFIPVAITEAFPYSLAWVLNSRSPYYFDCRSEIERAIQNSKGYLRPAPSIR